MGDSQRKKPIDLELGPIQDGRLAAILNAEIPLFSSAVTGGRRSLSYTGPSGVVCPSEEQFTSLFND